MEKASRDKGSQSLESGRRSENKKTSFFTWLGPKINRKQGHEKDSPVVLFSMDEIPQAVPMHPGPSEWYILKFGNKYIVQYHGPDIEGFFDLNGI